MCIRCTIYNVQCTTYTIFSVSYIHGYKYVEHAKLQIRLYPIEYRKHINTISIHRYKSTKQAIVQYTHCTVESQFTCGVYMFLCDNSRDVVMEDVTIAYFTIYINVQCQCTKYINVQCTMYINVQCTMYIDVHCTLYSALCILIYTTLYYIDVHTSI